MNRFVPRSLPCVTISLLVAFLAFPCHRSLVFLQYFKDLFRILVYSVKRFGSVGMFLFFLWLFFLFYSFLFLLFLLLLRCLISHVRLSFTFARDVSWLDPSPFPLPFKKWHFLGGRSFCPGTFIRWLYLLKILPNTRPKAINAKEAPRSCLKTKQNKKMRR